MSLSVSLRHRQGDFLLDVDFDAPPGVTALFGASGAGKTSVVRAIAGLLRPAQGRIELNGQTLLDTGRGFELPPHRRRIGYVFQEPRLFPHLNVKQNLLYGRWFTGSRNSSAALAPVVDLLDLGPLLDRRTTRLSGGECQRVAIGRALLASPRLLLMDEPFAAIDEGRKSELLPYLERLRDAGAMPIVYVSHSAAEVARLATSVVRLAQGRVVSVGTPAEVLGRVDLPSTELEAGSVLDAEVLGHEEEYGLTVLICGAARLRVPRLDRAAGTRLKLWIRARDVMLARDPPSRISALNVLRGRVIEVGAPEGAGQLLRLDCAGGSLLARITRLSLQRLELAPGIDVHAVIKSVSFES